MEKDLFLISVFAVILVIAVIFFPTSLLRIVIGLPFILFFPGYALVSALFPGKRSLDEIERVALSLGLSIAVVPLIGLALNYTPFGVRLYPVVLSLFLFTILMSIAAICRRGALSLRDRFAPSFSISLPRWRELSDAGKALSIYSVITSVVVAGALTAHFATTPRIGERFTEFYVLGPEGKVQGYPTNMILGEGGTVILGVVNHEYEEARYSVVIKLDNETVGRIDGIKLRHEEKWEGKTTFTPHKVGDEMKLDFLLYKNDEAEPYRMLHLWLSVKTGP